METPLVQLGDERSDGQAFPVVAADAGGIPAVVGQKLLQLIRRE